MKSTARIVFSNACVVFIVMGAMGSASWGQVEGGTVSVSPHMGTYVFDNDQGLDTRAVYGLGLGYNLDSHWAAEVVLDYIATKTDPGDVHMNVFNSHLDLLYHLMPDKRFVPYLALGGGATTFHVDGGDTNVDPLVNYGIGAKFFLTKWLALRGDVRHVIVLGDTDHNLAATGGFSLIFGGRRAASPPPPPVERVADSDSDGIRDDLDRCPGTPSGVAVDRSGCQPDGDHDGVYDSRDRCPNTPEGIAVNARGCPADRDHDGVSDDLDRCPATPTKAAVDRRGCALDSDGDGVADHIDGCPDTPRGATVDGRGCWVLAGVRFNSGETTLKASSAPTLMSVLGVLEQNPNLRIEIEGHTDSTGSAAFNQRLSEKRARAVLEFLASRGIERTRLSSRGYGPSRPAASNDTAAGRAQNRRVELKPVR